jgi:N-methylhydantoinase A
VGAFEVARTAGYEKIITLDMGGTSTDVCLCDGRIETTNENVIGHHPVSIQSIGIHSVGAGGGSIAWVDEGGLLKVGPRSAGADPGPLCYGRGTEPTVTDANVLLGRIDPDLFLGGEMKLFPEKIGGALDQLSSSLTRIEGRNWETGEIAEGIIRIVNTQMERALRVISLQRGYDTRDFTLVTFGGAGGLHACELSRALLIPRVLVPVHPGALSALGILRADVVQDVSRTLVLSSEEESLVTTLSENLVALEEEVTARLEQQGFERKTVELERSVDARYLGQSYELNIPFSNDLIAQFHKRHGQVYGYSNDGLTVEVVNLRVRARARYPLPAIPEFTVGGPEPVKEALLQEKAIRGGGKPVRFFIRSKLAAGNRFDGPAVVVEYSATTWVPEDFSVYVDQWLNLIIEPRK